MKNALIRYLFLSLLFAVIPAHAAATQPLDRIVAVVNKNVILQSELNNETRTIKEQLAGKVELPPDDVFEKQVLERLIIEKLQLDEAESYGITVDDITLNEHMQAIAQHNKMTLSGLRKQLESEGLDYETFRQAQRTEMILNELRRNLIGSRVKISEAELDEYLASQDDQDNNSEYLVSHIQISLPDDANKEAVQKAKQRADAIYDRLQKGEDFGKLAIAESDGRAALEGGDLGWHKLSELPKQFATELRIMTPGDVSKPFKMTSGFNILKLRETRGIKRVIVKQVKVRHILMTTDKLNTDEQVRKKLADIRQQILDGADFGKMATQYSRDNGSAAAGGELDWAEPSIYEPQFRKVIEKLPVGKISEPFKTGYGWHIAEVIGWRDYDKTVDVIRNTAYQQLYQRKAMVEEDLWVRRLRSEAFVDIRLDKH